LKGFEEGWGLSLTHPFFRNRFHMLIAEFGFDLRDTTQNVFGNVLQSLDRVRLLKFGVSYQGTDVTGRSFASVYLYQGLGTAFGGSSNNNPVSSRQDAGNSFTYATINLTRVQTITSFLRAIVRASGQVTSAPLVVSEQFSLGGPDTVKGYHFRELVGDNGFNAGAELRVLPIPGERADEKSEIFQLSLGIDYGLVEQRKPAPGEDKTQRILGYGPGVRLNVPFEIFSRKNYFWTNFDVGFPISPSKNADGSRPVYYVQTGVRF
jgi:hemolysin activation/secretion protein